MRQQTNRYSAWEFVGNAVLRFIKRKQPDFFGDSGIVPVPDSRILGDSRIVAVLIMAINPAAFGEAVKNDKARELARVFADAYTADPELTLRLLELIRNKWQASSVAAKVQKHVLTHAFAVRPIWKKRKCLQSGVLMQDAQAYEIQFAVDPKLKTKDSEPGKVVSAVKKAMPRFKPPERGLLISPELNAALRVLSDAGFDVGLG